MGAIEVLKEFYNKAKIKNIMIFVSDSLRWDYTPNYVKKQGITFKTIAASIFTASSFPSIISGLYPYNHNVYSFFDKMPRAIPTLLSLPRFDVSLWCENTWIDWKPRGSSQLHRILRFKTPKPLTDLNPPFIYIEDEKGGHCPYGWTENDVYHETDCKSFFKDYGKKTIKELNNRYELGIKRSVKEFKKRIKILEEKDVIDETLIIFTSDHGELLGEYGGLIGHGNVTTPELVYVPTIFIHPELPKGENFANEGVVRHVDLFPTILDLLGFNIRTYKVDGASLFRVRSLPQYGKSYYKVLWTRLYLTEKGIWDKDGGYVFREGSQVLRLLRLMKYSIRPFIRPSDIEGIYLREKLKREFIKTIKGYPKLMKVVYAKYLKFGEPNFDLKIARNLITESKIKFDETYVLKMKIAELKEKGKIRI